MRKRLLRSFLMCAVIVAALALTACNVLKTKDDVSRKVTYMDGTTVIDSVSSDGTGVLPPTPTKEGKNFEGWFTDEACTVPYTETSNSQGDVTLYAKWSDKTFIVTFIGEDGQPLKNETVVYGTAATAPQAPSILYKSFCGWDRAFDNVKSNMTVSALYSANTSKISFYLGDEMVYDATVEEGLAVESYANTAFDEMTIPSGFDFEGWYMDANRTIKMGSACTVPTADTSFYAKLELQPLTSFNLSTSAPNNATTYGTDEYVAITNGFSEISAGITYTYNWTENGTALGSGKSLNYPVSSVGAHVVSLLITASANNLGYSVTSVSTSANVTINVMKGSFSVQAEGFDGTYDGNAHGINVSAAAGDTVTYSTDKSTWLSALSFTDAGTYNVYYKVTRANYADYISESAVTVKIDKATLTVTADDKTVKYGDQMPRFTVAVTGFLKDDGLSVVSGRAGFTCGAVATDAVGTFVIKPSLGTLSSKNYNFEFISGTLTVEKRALTITANDKTVTYGDDVPDYSASYLGFADGDSATSLDGSLAFVCDYVKGSPVTATGYTLTPVGLTSDNYDITFVPGTVSILKKDASVTAENKTVTYGDVAPVYTAETLNNVDALNYSINCTYVQGDGAGTYAISIVLGENPNYNVSATDALLTVNTRSISVSVSTRTGYTGSVWSYEFEDIAGLYSDDLLEGTLSTTSAEIGTYSASGKMLGDNFIWEGFDITHDGESYLDSYEITYSLSVEIYDTTIAHSASGYSGTYDGKAHSISVVCALDDAEITYSADGVSYTSTNLSYTTVGTYKVYYKITAVDKDTVLSFAYVEISAVPLTVTADNKNVTFGDDVPEYTVSYDGFVNGETSTVLGGTLSCTCDYAKGSPVSTEGYALTPGGLTSTNYIITFTSGKVFVSALSAAVVWAKDTSYTYSGENQAATVTATYKNISGTDVNASVTFNGGTEFTAAGTYTVRATTADTNYALSGAEITLVMDKATYASAPTVDKLVGTQYFYGITLNNFELPENCTWKDGTTKIHCNGTDGNAYTAVYNADSANYYDKEFSVTIALTPISVGYTAGTVQEFNYAAGTLYDFDTSLLVNSAGIEGVYTVQSGEGRYGEAGTYGFTVSFVSSGYPDYVGSATCFVKIKSVKIGSVLYTIEDALAAAQGNDTVIITADTSFATGLAKGCYSAANYVVKQNVTLLVPFAATDTQGWIGPGEDGSDNYTAHPASTGTPTLYLTLEIPSDVTLTVNGNLVVGAMTASKAAGNNQNAISGAYSQIVLAGNILVVNATLRVMGYVIGAGTITAENSTVIENLHLTGWPGGTVATTRYAGDYNALSVVLSGLNVSNPKMFPFSKYALRSIRANLIIKYGSTLQGYVKIATSAVSSLVKAQINEALLTFISSSASAGDGIIRLSNNDSYAVKSYYRDTVENKDRVSIELHGNISDGYSAMSISIIGKTADMSSQKLFFPVDGLTDVRLAPGCNLTVNYAFKLMPGARLIVEDGAELTLNGKLCAYDKNFVGQGAVDCSNPGVDSLVQIDGRMTVNGSFGGSITSSGTGIVSFGASAVLEVTSTEGTGAKDGSLDFVFTEANTVTKQATLTNADKSTVTPTKGTTYTYNSATGRWE